ncbi:MAG: hypothetical protein CVV27_21160 [Candidatus Melainabacteria bacterium HGW-Melainabacteria-1]|nr:MAG: hypothetical protein CVV27_21160 [Candidatus Melainabacteria bacterium HGW-Melainabacteria-1]
MKDAEFSEVLGYVNYKDIVSALQINPEDPSLKGICRPILIFNEGEGLNIIFSRLTRGYQHIALVQDDSGAVTGLITLEDVIEEIIGDLMDEYDVLPSHVLQMTKTRRVVGGGITASDSKTRLGIELPVDAGNLSEWIIGRFGAVPRAGHRFSHGKHEFIVKKTTRGNIFEVIIEEKTE